MHLRGAPHRRVRPHLPTREVGQLCSGEKQGMVTGLAEGARYVWTQFGCSMSEPTDTESTNTAHSTCALYQDLPNLDLI